MPSIQVIVPNLVEIPTITLAFSISAAGAGDGVDGPLFESPEGARPLYEAARDAWPGADGSLRAVGESGGAAVEGTSAGNSGAFVKSGVKSAGWLREDLY